LETARSNANPTGFYASNMRASFESQGRQDDVTTRVTNCLARAFHAIGASSVTQQMIYWKLSTTKNIGPSDILLRPLEFIEGIHDIYGDAGTVVFEYMFAREIIREFGLNSEPHGSPRPRDVPGLLQLVARS